MSIVTFHVSQKKAYVVMSFAGGEGCYIYLHTTFLWLDIKNVICNFTCEYS